MQNGWSAAAVEAVAFAGILLINSKENISKNQHVQSLVLDDYAPVLGSLRSLDES